MAGKKEERVSKNIKRVTRTDEKGGKDIRTYENLGSGYVRQIAHETVKPSKKK